MNVIDKERDCSAEFSDLYLHLLDAALDEKNPSPSPQIRRHNLAVHVAREISAAGTVSEPDSQPGNETWGNDVSLIAPRV
jgi:hypothetical protein